MGRMKKITVTIENVQDQDIKDIRLEYARNGKLFNYSKVLRMIIDEGLKKF